MSLRNRASYFKDILYAITLSYMRRDATDDDDDDDAPFRMLLDVNLPLFATLLGAKYVSFHRVAKIVCGIIYTILFGD